MDRQQIKKIAEQYAEIKGFQNGIIVSIPCGMDMTDARYFLGNLRVRLQQEKTPIGVIMQPGVYITYALKERLQKDSNYMEEFLDKSLEFGNSVSNVCMLAYTRR